MSFVMFANHVMGNALARSADNLLFPYPP